MDWDYLFSTLSKAAKLFNRDDMTDMLANDYEAIEKDGGPSKDASAYVNRVLARAKYSNIEMPINRTWYDDINKIVTIGNYNYPMFKWAIKKGFGKEIDNLCIRFKICDVTESERNSIMSRIKQNS